MHAGRIPEGRRKGMVHRCQIEQDIFYTVIYTVCCATSHHRASSRLFFYDFASLAFQYSSIQLFYESSLLLVYQSMIWFSYDSSTLRVYYSRLFLVIQYHCCVVFKLSERTTPSAHYDDFVGANILTGVTFCEPFFVIHGSTGTPNRHLQAQMSIRTVYLFCL